MARENVHLLLVEPQWLIRSTVVSVGRTLGLPRIDEVSSVEGASQRLSAARYDGLVLSLDEGEPALALLDAVREGRFACAADIPLVVMTAGCDFDLARRVKRLGVGRVILKPFKVKTVLESIEAMSRQVEQPRASRSA